MSDKEWARIQTFVNDALAPLMSLLEINAKGETIMHDQALEAAMAVIQLLGNASAQISHGWRTKVLTHLNKSQLPLLEEDANFEDIAPSLFGPEFVRKSKELVDQVRAIRSTTQEDGKSLFQQGQLGSLLSPPSNRRLMVGRGKKIHINCLELLAVTLAVKSFAKHRTRISILLRIDNTTAVAYINHLGGTIS